MTEWLNWTELKVKATLVSPFIPNHSLGPLFSLPCSVQFSAVTLSHLTLCDPMDYSTPSLLVHQQLPEFTQIHIHWVGDAIQPSHPLSSPSPPALNLSKHQGLFKWVSSSHQVAKVLAATVLDLFFVLKLFFTLRIFCHLEKLEIRASFIFRSSKTWLFYCFKILLANVSTLF